MSSRKNEDRIGSPNLDSDVPVTPETMGAPPMPPNLAQNPQMQASPLTFVTPTEFVELPSSGRFFNTRFLLHQRSTWKNRI